jgi:hypothetical protein
MHVNVFMYIFIYIYRRIIEEIEAEGRNMGDFNEKIQDKHIHFHLRMYINLSMSISVCLILYTIFLYIGV